MSISGNLKTMELAELLQWVAQSGKTGTLLIGDGRSQKKIYFEAGRIVATGSTDESEQLGTYLVRRGFLTDEKLTEAISYQETSGMLLGKILVANRFLDEEQLQQILLTKAQEMIFSLFGWPEGDFRFAEDEKLDGEGVSMRLEVAAVVLQGMERIDDWRRIRELIPSPDYVPVLVSGDLGGLELKDGDADVVGLIDDRRSVGEIVDGSAVGDFRVCKLLLDLASHGLLKLVEPRGAAAPADGEGTVSAATLLAIAERHVDEGDLPQALRYLRAARHLDPNGDDTQRAISRTEGRMRDLMRDEGMSLKAVPVVSVASDRIQDLQLSPEEGFVLSRIDGTYDIESILKISPMPPLEAQLVFRKLLLEGHIQLDPVHP